MVEVTKRVRIVLEGNDAIWLAHLARYNRQDVVAEARRRNEGFAERIDSTLQKIAAAVPPEGFSSYLEEDA